MIEGRRFVNVDNIDCYCSCCCETWIKTINKYFTLGPGKKEQGTTKWMTNMEKRGPKERRRERKKKNQDEKEKEKDEEGRGRRTRPRKRGWEMLSEDDDDKRSKREMRRVRKITIMMNVKIFQEGISGHNFRFKVISIYLLPMLV